jgi:hypothetical protein
MLTITNHDQLTIKPVDLPVHRYVLADRLAAKEQDREPEFEPTPLNPK